MENGDPSVQRPIQFFGEISAGVTHELKNHLAVVKEQSGLLEDLLALVERGKPLDPVRISRIASTILQHVDRANDAIRRFNRLSHAVDQDRQTVMAGELLRDVAGFAHRPAAVAGLKVAVVGPDQDVSISTDPFSLQCLILKYLKAILAKPPVGSRELTFTLTLADGAIAVSLDAVAMPMPEVCSDLASRLGVDIETANDGRTVFRIPLRCRCAMEPN